MNKSYKHKTTGQPCNAAQYIAEMVCLREAEKQNVGRPAYALWNTEKWKKKFQSQVTRAYQLLKNYHEKAIINALNSYGGVILTQGQNALSAERMIVDLNTGKATLEGRVKTILQTGGN